MTGHSRVDRRRRQRPLWVIFHIGILAAGISFVVWGSVPVIETAGRSLTYVWGVSFVLGSALSLTGVLFRRWTGEIVGMPLEMGGLLAYAVSLWLTLPGLLTRTGLALLLSALVLPLWARWRDTTILATLELERARP